MKTLTFFSLMIALALTGCLKDDDIANPAMMDVTSTTETFDSDGNGLSLYPGYCKDIQTEHFLLGKGAWEVQDASGEQYVINASGHGVLNETIGRSELTLTYDRETNIFSGSLTSRFESATMVHSFYGRAAGIVEDAPDTSKDPAIEGKAEFVRGVMTTELGDFLLREGASLKISAIPAADGEVDVKVSINGVYCTRVNPFVGRR